MINDYNSLMSKSNVVYTSKLDDNHQCNTNVNSVHIY